MSELLFSATRPIETIGYRLPIDKGDAISALSHLFLHITRAANPPEGKFFVLRDIIRDIIRDIVHRVQPCEEGWKGRSRSTIAPALLATGEPWKIVGEFVDRPREQWTISFNGVTATISPSIENQQVRVRLDLKFSDFLVSEALERSLEEAAFSQNGMVRTGHTFGPEIKFVCPDPHFFVFTADTLKTLGGKRLTVTRTHVSQVFTIHPLDGEKLVVYADSPLKCANSGEQQRHPEAFMRVGRILFRLVKGGRHNRVPTDRIYAYVDTSLPRERRKRTARKHTAT